MSGCNASGMRSPIRFGWAAAAMAAAGFVLGSAALGARETRIVCDLTGARHEHYGYTFTIDHEKGVLLWIEGDEELKIERRSPTELLASRHGKFGASSANAAFFDLSLFSGTATMTYLHEPTPAEVAQCERQQPSGCRDPVELPQYAESGGCTVTDSGGN